MTKQETDQIALLFKALSNPIRIGIITELLREDKNANELCTAIGCSQSLMSQQIKILKNQGFLACRKEGTRQYCQITSENLQQTLCSALRTLREISSS